MSHPWRSKFIWGVGTDLTNWTTILPATWERSTETVGGYRIAAGGVPASHVVREDYLLNLHLRLYETEWPDLEALVAWGRSAESFLWLPEQSASTTHLVYLQHPGAGETLQEQKSGDYPGLKETTLVLRNALGYAWDLRYFTCE